MEETQSAYADESEIKPEIEFMYLWPTYYTLEIRVYIPTIPLFYAALLILYVSWISFCGMLFLAGCYIFITSRSLS
jgi:hypothetical protein